MLYVQFVLIVLASIIPYLFTLDGDFVFDDSEAIVKNNDVVSTSWTNPFFNDFWGTNIQSNLSHKSYRPLAVLSFKLNYFLNNSKLSALQFKITNLVFHSLCTALVWLLYESIILSTRPRIIGKTTYISFLAALLFAVHPIHVEAVCGIVGRADLLAGITFCLSFLLYNKCLRSNSLTFVYLFISIMFAAVSMLFKENGVTVLGVCLVYEFIRKFENKCIKKPLWNIRRHSIVRVVTLIFSIVLLLYGRWLIMGSTKPSFKTHDNPSAFSNNTFTKVVSLNYVYFLNALLLVWPQWLCYDWSMGCIPLIENTFDVRILFTFSMYIYGVLLILSICKKENDIINKRLILIAVSIIVLPFLPASNIFYTVGFVIAERILYIPSAGYCLLLAIGLNKLYYRTTSKSYKKIVITMYAFLVLMYSLRSYERSCEWQNEKKLFIAGLRVCPLNAKVLYNVAKVADAENQTDRALDYYKVAIRLYPEYYQAMNNLANLLKDRKDYSQAEKYLRDAIKYKREFPAAWMNLGIVLANTGRNEESYIAYKTALKYRNKYPDCLYNLGILYLQMNKTNEALDSWFQTVNLEPTHALAWTNLLALLDNTEQFEKVSLVIPDVLKILPHSPSINFAIANIYGKLGRYEEAEEHFSKAIRFFGNRVQAIHYANFGVLYHRWKKYDLAEEMYSKALSIDPSFQSAIKNLRSLKRLDGRKS